MKNKFIFLIFFNLSVITVYAQLITNHTIIPQPTLIKPALWAQFLDPAFNSTIKRIADGSATNIQGVFPDYSKHQAWNFDESLLMLRTGNGDVQFYNGTTFQYLKSFPPSIAGIQDIFWHPSNPVLLYYAFDNTFNVIDEQTDQITLLHTFTNYSYVTTRAEGNMSNDGSFIAMCGYDANWNPIDFFVYDVALDSVISSLNVSTNVSSFDWISISPLGNFVIVDYADETVGRYHGLEVYDRQMNFIWQKPLGAGHSDIGFDINGSEVLIMDVYDSDSNLTYIKKIGLADSSVVTLLGVSPEFDLHESCRSMSRPGWVYISTFDFVGRLTDDSTSWLPFEDEIFALKMDGSGNVERLAHHHSRRYSPTTPNSDSSVYYAEPHATVNRTGTRILFGSNWRQNIELNTSVDAYICDISLLINSVTNSKWLDPNEIAIYPNPFRTNATIGLNIDLKNAELLIYNLLGKELKKIKNISGQKFTFNRENLTDGIYFYQLRQDNNLISNGKFIVE